MEMTGTCQCGGLRLSVHGEPLRVGICHCTACQKRTGAMHSLNAYYRKDQVGISGAPRKFMRDAQEGRTLTNYFCADCGTTVCWEADVFPDQYGIAVGIFSDPDFSPPVTSTWECFRYRWVVLPEGMQHFDKGRPIP